MSDTAPRSSKTLVIIIAIVTGLGLYNCSGNQDQQTASSPTSYSTYSHELSDAFAVTSAARYPSPSPIDTATTAATVGTNQPAICEGTPSPSGVSLISVTVVEGAAGHPSGAATATWNYNGDVSADKVTFSITSNSATCVVTFLGGEMTTNTFISAGKNTPITIPIPFTSYEQQIPIPAAIGPSFSQDWTADMLVNGVQVGQCRAGL